MTHDIQWPAPRIDTSADGSDLILPQGQATGIFRRKFGQAVDIVVFGDTHYELVCDFDGVILVNPGSPTFPARRKPGILGTLGFIETGDADMEPGEIGAGGIKRGRVKVWTAEIKE